MARTGGPTGRYVLMPAEGFLAPELERAELVPARRAIAVAARAAAPRARPEVRILESIHENGPKLVELSPEGELSLRLSLPGIKIVPEVFYRRQWYRPQVLGRPRRAASMAANARPAGGLAVTVVDSRNGRPVRGATIVAFTDFLARAGESATTNARGIARLRFLSSRQRLERVYVYGPAGFWGHYAANTTGARVARVALDPIDPVAGSLLLRQLYGDLPANAGAGVKIGIVDTGVDGGHPDLRNVVGGRNCVGDEVRANAAAQSEWGPARIDGEHGSHVAGIAAARGGDGGFRGVAPGADLESYRVFPHDGGLASNFDIAKAVDAAALSGCTIINLSLGGGPADDLTRAAIRRAVNLGAVVVAAAGNDGREPVSYPAAYPESVAVSAMGRRGSFPAESTGEADFADPSSGSDFVAAFSNVGSQIDVVGPGVEIVSTLPGGGYGSMSGTSMAAPAISGFAAHLLARESQLGQLSGSTRSRAIKDALYSRAKPKGFGRNYEGFGLPEV